MVTLITQYFLAENAVNKDSVSVVTDELARNIANNYSFITVKQFPKG